MYLQIYFIPTHAWINCIQYISFIYFYFFTDNSIEISISTWLKLHASVNRQGGAELQVHTHHSAGASAYGQLSLKALSLYISVPFSLSKCKCCEQAWIWAWAVGAALSVSEGVLIQSSCCPVTLIASAGLLPPIMLGCNPHQLMTCQGFHVISQPFQQTIL